MEEEKRPWRPPAGTTTVADYYNNPGFCRWKCQVVKLDCNEKYHWIIEPVLHRNRLPCFYYAETFDTDTKEDSNIWANGGNLESVTGKLYGLRLGGEFQAAFIGYKDDDSDVTKGSLDAEGAVMSEAYLQYDTNFKARLGEMDGISHEEGEELMEEGPDIVMAFSDYTAKLSKRIRFRYYTPREISEFMKTVNDPEAEQSCKTGGGLLSRETYLTLAKYLSNSKPKTGGKMNKGDLIERLAQDCKLTKATAEKVLNSALGAIADVFSAGDKVTLVGFGTFAVSERAACEGHNPQSGKAIAIPAK